MLSASSHDPQHVGHDIGKRTLPMVLKTDILLSGKTAVLK